MVDYIDISRPEIQKAAQLAEELAAHCKKHDLSGLIIHGVAVDAVKYGNEVRTKTLEMCKAGINQFFTKMVEAGPQKTENIYD